MSEGNLTVTVRVAWWFTPYMHVLCLVAAITGREPDWAKLCRMIERALKIEIKPRRQQ